MTLNGEKSLLTSNSSLMLLGLRKLDMPDLRDRAESRILTPREVEVVRLVAQHLSNKEIGHRLKIDPETVETHLKRARRKLGAVDRKDAARLAFQHGVTGDWGHHSVGIAQTGEVLPDGGAVGVTAEDSGKGLQFLYQGLLTGLDKTGIVGRLLWISGMAVLIGLLAVGLLVAADGFTLTIHNLQANGHAR